MLFLCDRKRFDILQNLLYKMLIIFNTVRKHVSSISFFCNPFYMASPL